MYGLLLGKVDLLTKEVNRLFWWKMAAIVLLFSFLLFICLYFLKVRLSIDLSVKGKDMHVQIEVFISRFRVFKMTLPSLDIEEDPFELIIKSHNTVTGKEEIGVSSKELGPQWRKLGDFWRTVKDQRKLLQLFQIHHFSWETEIGCDQADWTAMVTGFMWAIKTNVIGLLNSVLKISDMEFDVRPRFNQWVFETHFSCMISFRLGKAIGQAVRIRRQYKRRRHTRGRASYSRVNEDSA